jgi:hypothetical protein
MWGNARPQTGYLTALAALTAAPTGQAGCLAGFPMRTTHSLPRPSLPLGSSPAVVGILFDPSTLDMQRRIWTSVTFSPGEGDPFPQTFDVFHDATLSLTMLGHYLLCPRARNSPSSGSPSQPVWPPPVTGSIQLSVFSQSRPSLVIRARV